MSEVLQIKPFQRPLLGQQVTPPGSKSITNRALLLAALDKHETTLEGALFSRDTTLMAAALAKLGFQIKTSPETHSMSIQGKNGRIPNAKAALEVGNAGTAARFLTALLSLHPSGHYHVSGDTAMNERPMQGLLEALSSEGKATFHCDHNAFSTPFTMDTEGLTGGTISVDASSSSQILSALLMVSPHATSPLTVVLQGDTVSHPFVKMTLDMMVQFGYQLINTDSPTHYLLQKAPGKREDPMTYLVEPDATAASYFLALPIVVGGHLEVGMLLNSLQGDADFANVLQHHGYDITRQSEVTLTRGGEHKQAGIQANFNAISDTFLTLAAIAPLLDGPTKINGIAHTRKQETDRIAAMATELKRLGQKVIETEDSIEIHPQPLQPATINTYEDHRIAMSFGILGCHDLKGDGSPWLSIEDPLCCRKTFPDFFNILENLYQTSHS